MTDNEKQIRFSVLQMAQTMCDQEFLFSYEQGGEIKKPFPTPKEVIGKATELMSFVDDIADPTVKTVTQLLSEHSGK
jgi:hypothetical protein